MDKDKLLAELAEIKDRVVALQSQLSRFKNSDEFLQLNHIHGRLSLLISFVAAQPANVQEAAKRGFDS
jgi:hypothetical protein